MDFGTLPPEINSGRMYSGVGSGPMLAAAAAWDGLAAELSSTAASYESIVAGLTSETWSGPSSAAMAAAATPYAAWMSNTAAQAEQSATQARAAAAAYDAAFSGTVPPPVIAANRSLLMSLIATNVLGQNTAAIAAAEAHYAEMWAQDAGAMYGYAGASATATVLAPFSDPPSTTNSVGLAGQPAAAVGANAQTALSQLISTVPQALQGLAASAPPAQAGLLSILDSLAGPLGPASLYGIGGVPYLLAIQCVLLPMNGSNVVAALARAEKMTDAGKWPPNPFDPRVFNAAEAGANPQLVSSATTTPSVSARIGNAGSVGRLAVPQGWTAATPAAKAVAAALPDVGAEAVTLAAANSESGLMSNLALGSLAGRAIGTAGGAASRKVGQPTGAVTRSKPSTATIIVIPPSAED